MFSASAWISIYHQHEMFETASHVAVCVCFEQTGWMGVFIFDALCLSVVVISYNFNSPQPSPL